MKTKTFTLLVTITDDGCAGVFNAAVLADAVKGALECGIPSFVLSQKAVYAVGAGSAGDAVNLSPVASAEVDAFDGDIIEMTRIQALSHTNDDRRVAKRMHAALHK